MQSEHNCQRPLMRAACAAQALEAICLQPPPVVLDVLFNECMRVRCVRWCACLQMSLADLTRCHNEQEGRDPAATGLGSQRRVAYADESQEGINSLMSWAAMMVSRPDDIELQVLVRAPRSPGRLECRIPDSGMFGHADRSRTWLSPACGVLHRGLPCFARQRH